MKMVMPGRGMKPRIGEQVVTDQTQQRSVDPAAYDGGAGGATRAASPNARLNTSPRRPVGPKQPAPRAQPAVSPAPPSQAGSLAGWTRAMANRQQAKASNYDREWDRLDRAETQAPTPMPSTDEAEIRRLARMRRSRLGQ